MFSGRSLWWSQGWVWTPQSPMLRQSHSQTVPAPVLQALPNISTDTRIVSLPNSLMCLSQARVYHVLSMPDIFWCPILMSPCTELCWRKVYVICAWVPLYVALDPFCHDFPASAKPSHSCFSTASTSWCLASLPDTSSSCAKFTTVSFLLSTYFQGRGRVTPRIFHSSYLLIVSHVESLIRYAKSCEQGKAGSAFHWCHVLGTVLDLSQYCIIVQICLCPILWTKRWFFAQGNKPFAVALSVSDIWQSSPCNLRAPWAIASKLR